MASPLPTSLVLLTLALPGVWLAGRWLARRATGDRALAAWLAPGVGVALCLLAVHGIGLASKSFVVGIVAGITGLALAGAVGALRDRGAEPPSESGDPPSRWIWPAAIAATAPIAWIAFHWAFHDENWVTGHLSIVSQIQNGIYPPRHLNFPEFELRYHYGFDLVAATFSALFHLHADTAIDAVTVLGWGYTFCLLWLLGDRLVGKNSGPLTAVLTLLGGGIPYFCTDTYSRPPVQRLLGFCDVNRSGLNPPIISYFFQHPWSLGLPLAICVLLVFLERRPSPVRWLALAALLAALSLGQFVLFACVLASVVAAEAFVDGSFSLRRALGALALAAVVLAAAKLAHGFFAPPPDGGSSDLLFVPGTIGRTPWGLIHWHFLTYGLLLPLGVAGFFLLKSERLLLVLLTLGSLAILNLFIHARSWDIVKFGTVTAFALSVAASASVARLLSSRPLLKLAALVLLVAATASGVVFAATVIRNPAGVPFTRAVAGLAAVDQSAIAVLRGRIRAGEVVYRRGTASPQYARWGGLPVVWFDAMTPAWGISPALMAARQKLVDTGPEDPESYLAQRVRWLVLEPADGRLNTVADGWIKNGRAELVSVFGPLRLIRIR